ncbi:AbfB domain-containing protein [Actinoplanes friuliensis]|uniref:Arabinofuranosidase n=1 Tax=Actinoplanes friuliensis DSM 7358 TaxID=1246995 RepID=U5VXX0_9ACTN|nr:AbfB domain-containing protein [Actinoplanes friuliensis]AGZ41843.1 arabinofuranosidase [Actinoplanes friuliensis DSM 7358]
MPVSPAGAHRLAPRLRPRTVVAGAATLSALFVIGLVLAPEEKEARRPPMFIALPTVPEATVPAADPSSVPASVPSSTAAPRPFPSRSTVRVTSDSISTVRPPAARRVASPRPSLPVVGSSIGLGSASVPGLRVRHRDYRAYLEEVGARSSAQDRADSRFTVRPGRARTGCLSFESQNFPGYFLRHRNFVLRLDRVDGSALFDADTTFCAVPVTGGGFVLRAHNYPDHYLTERDSLLSLIRTRPAEATAFVTRPVV